MKVYEIISEGTGSSILAAIDKFASTTPISGKAVTLKTEKVLGGYLKIIKYLNLATFIYQFMQHRMVIEKMIQAGELEKEDYPVAMRLEAEKMVVSMIASGAILRVIQFFFRIFLVGRIATGVVGTAAGIFTGGILAPESIALLLAQEAAALYLQKWLATKEGQQCVAYVVLHLVDPGVKVLWDLGPGTFAGKLKDLSSKGQAGYDKKLGPGDIGDKISNKLNGLAGTAGTALGVDATSSNSKDTTAGSSTPNASINATSASGNGLDTDKLLHDPANYTSDNAFAKKYGNPWQKN